MSRSLLQRKRTWVALAAVVAAALAVFYWPEISRLCARIHWADIDRAVRAGMVKPGELVLLQGVGAGMAWGSALIRW